MPKGASRWLKAVACLALLLGVFAAPVKAAEEQGSVGLTATIAAPPPTEGATITIPTNGQVFTSVPIRVSGTCPTGLLIKLFKNNVFSGSQMCENGSFSLQTDLFNGQNDLVARVYDALDQAGPDSNTVTVTFNDSRGGLGSRVTLTTNYAKRGANPGEVLTWPVIISGGVGPYAISVDWGDGKPADIKSQQFPGAVDLTHIYDAPGVYNIIVRVSDKDGVTAFLQLVGVGNGPLEQTDGTSQGEGDVIVRTKTPWLPLVASIPLIIATFWLGKRYELKKIRDRIEHGDRPF